MVAAIRSSEGGGGRASGECNEQVGPGKGISDVDKAFERPKRRDC